MRTRARARAPRMLQDFFCGTLMGAVATPAKMPFFVVKTRKQVTVTDSNRL
jgi:cytochrome c biogenesis protein CcdA